MAYRVDFRERPERVEQGDGPGLLQPGAESPETRRSRGKIHGQYYRQHNPGAADGADAFIAFVHGFTGAYPGLHFDFRRFVAEGDLVVVHSHLAREPGDRGMAVMDIFRIENNRIVEHWDVLQEIPVLSANENTMF
jgi:predicted SnoaL-like aldol condensation-catalyzing enzyme